MYFLLTRPLDHSRRLARRLTTLGHEVQVEPLLDITPVASSEKVAPDDFQALLFTSANGVAAFQRAYGNQLDFSHLRCFAVGAATAGEARDAGFGTVAAAGGDVAKLAALVQDRLTPASGPLLHIAGKQVAGDLAGDLARAGFRVESLCLYQATAATALSPPTRALIRAGRITHIPFYSPRTAGIFKALIDKADLAPHLKNTTAVCLSPAIANMIGSLPWEEILTAGQPEQRHLFRQIGIKLEEDRP